MRAAALLMFGCALLVHAEERHLSLAAAVELALKDQPRLQLAEAERAEQAARTANLDRLKVPRLQSGARQNGSADPIVGSPYSIFQPYDRALTGSTVVGASGSGLVPITGTRYVLGVEVQRLTNDRVDQPLAAQLQLRPYAELRQPLLRGSFGVEYQLATEIVGHGWSAADHRYVAEAQSTVLAVVESYWNAARARRAIEIRKKAVENAQQALKATEALLAGGRTTGETVLAARAEMARREQDLIEAQIREVRALLPLSALLHLGAEEGASTRLVLDEETLAVNAVDLPADPVALVAAAIEGNPTMLALSEARAAATSQLALSERALLPDLSLNVRAGLLGLGGQSACPSGFLRDGISTCAVPPSIGQGQVSGAFTTLSRGTYGFWEGGLVFETNFDNVDAYNATAQATRRLRSSEAEYELTRQRLVAEVLTRRRELELAVARAEQAGRAADIARQALAALQARFRLGGATIFDVQRLLDTLVFSEDAALQAAVDLTLAQARLDELRPGRLLERFHLTFTPAPSR